MLLLCRLKEFTFICLILVAISHAEVIGKPHHRSILAKKVQELKDQHHSEIEELKSEMALLRQEMQAHCMKHPIRHLSLAEERKAYKSTVEWTQKAMNELTIKMKEITNKVDSANLLQQLQTLRNNMNQIETENINFMNLARTLEAKLQTMDSAVQRIRLDKKNIDNTMGEMRSQLAAISNEVQLKDVSEEAATAEIIDNNVEIPKKTHKHRHSKVLHSELQRLSEVQDQLETSHQSILVQLLEQQHRIESLEAMNWDVTSTKLDFLEIQAKSFNDRLGNSTLSASDVAKMHASILQLREDLEAVESKMDKSIPELRKEMSKLDVDEAQMNARFSYVKQDQENLRMSVKAIAVSMSNTQDRAAENMAKIKTISATIEDLTTQAKKHYYKLNDHILKSEANTPIPETNLTETISLPELMGEVKELQPVEREYQDLVAQLPRDCTNVTGPAGSYIIRPAQNTVDVWCVNGTTLLQRRYNGSVEFNRNYAEYVRGFGDLTSEFWLGLETIHEITSDNCTSMRIDMTDIYGAPWYAQYDSFLVGSADTGYILEVSGFSGNASDAFEYQNHMEFSAIDRDRDISNTHCAGNYEGGWWFSHCQHVNINGKYTLGLTWFDSTHNEWIAVATTEMRVFRRPGCF